jgi:hypothetical protein
MNLTINFQRSYRKAGKTQGAPARVIFVYTVTGTADAVTNYRELNSAFLKEDDKGTPLFFTTRYAGERAALALNHSGTTYYVDNSEMDKQAALVAQYGGNLGQAIAMQIAAQAAGIAQRPSQGQTPPSPDAGLGSI